MASRHAEQLSHGNLDFRLGSTGRQRVLRRHGVRRRCTVRLASVAGDGAKATGGGAKATGDVVPRAGFTTATGDGHTNSARNLATNLVGTFNATGDEARAKATGDTSEPLRGRLEPHADFSNHACRATSHACRVRLLWAPTMPCLD